VKCLPESFYLSNNVVQISQLLLGKVLETKINNKTTSGIIVETEAYSGQNDKASHSYKNKKTQRNSAMFENGGHTYIYLCYGIHALFNVVTNIKEIPQAVLIRSIEPVKGAQHMLKRRGMKKISTHLTSGPGKLCQALGISLQHNKVSLQGPNISIYDSGITISRSSIIACPRIGVDYAGKDALKPWRFYIKSNPWRSK
tara:strand:- start:37 stop:633 length:597 start_codon:yes stop_codon:yes gene_type:complete